MAAGVSQVMCGLLGRTVAAHPAIKREAVPSATNGYARLRRGEDSKIIVKRPRMKIFVDYTNPPGGVGEHILTSVPFAEILTGISILKADSRKSSASGRKLKAQRGRFKGKSR